MKITAQQTRKKTAMKNWNVKWMQQTEKKKQENY